MKTIAKKTINGRKAATKINELARPFEDAAPQLLPVDQIAFSPLNYRKYFDQKALDAFASEMALHGILSPLLVRPAPEGGYELVAGERRLRAAKIAGITQVPAMIRELTDSQVTELQLSENLQRENPHPLHESQAVLMLQNSGMTIDKIAARLGKSKTFVFSRIKLAGLIEVLQQIFLANKITINEAFEIARLSPASQYELYEQYCTNWEDEGFELDNISYIIRRFKYDLHQAPFDIKDKTLNPEMGACGRCPFNSATIRSLFPELSKEAVCSNAACYKIKCSAHLGRQIAETVLQMKPQALVYSTQWSADTETLINTMPEIADLPRFYRWDISPVSAPEPPKQEEYTETEEEDGQEYFNDKGYKQALEEYHADLEAFNQAVHEGSVLTAIHIKEASVSFMLFTETKQQQTGSTTTVTAKEVQAAIKSGAATPEILDAEINRVQTRDQRALELDAEKVQSKIHEQFSGQFGEAENNSGLTEADLMGVRLIVYHSLNYSVRHQVSQAIFNGDETLLSKEHFSQTLKDLTDAQFSYLIRMAIAGNPDSKSPNYITGWCLYEMAQAAGMDVGAIERQQQAVAEERQNKADARIKDLEIRKGRLLIAV